MRQKLDRDRDRDRDRDGDRDRDRDRERQRQREILNFVNGHDSLVIEIFNSVRHNIGKPTQSNASLDMSFEAPVQLIHAAYIIMCCIYFTVP